MDGMNRNSDLKLLRALLGMLLCAAALLLGSCVAQKLPQHEAGFGLVAVPYQISNQTTYQLVKAIVLKSTEDADFSVRIDMPPFNDDVVISQPIPEGSYVVDYADAVSVPVSGVLDRGSTGRVNFTEPVRIDLKDGDIILFPMLFTAEQYRRADYVVCNINHQPLDPEQQNYYLNKLPAMENGAQWRVRANP
ncbi:MAG: hypothetical protein LJE64_14775 [Desulfofustis sp.]|nr:hypothetical protein [Desulfofustis sp.]